MDRTMGANINGPSLIRAPEWSAAPLGTYYLYFAAHRGRYIRMAWADQLVGPWQTVEGGVLSLGETDFVDHIASPDVHVLADRREVRMYFHGARPDGTQASRAAVSHDGLHFEIVGDMISPVYLRAFWWGGATYALAMPGGLYRAKDGTTSFEKISDLLEPSARHSAVLVSGQWLDIIYSRIGDRPEHLLVRSMRLSTRVEEWEPITARPLLLPELEFEGGNLPLHRSRRGAVNRPVRQLRDPALFRDDGSTWLLYAVAGEGGIGLAELVGACQDDAREREP